MRFARFSLAAAALLAASLGLVMGQDKGKGGKGGGKKGGINLPPSIQLTVAGMTDLGRFPAENAGPGKGSPALSWTQVPEGTQSFVILFHDPEPVLNKMASLDVTHWLIYDIPGDTRMLPAGVPAGAELPSGARQFPNIAGQPAYFGPAPPAGHGVHHYTFEIWALDTKLGPISGTDRTAVIKAMDGHVLAHGVTIGTYSNP